MEKELPNGWEEDNLLKISNVITGRKDANFGTQNGEYDFFTCAILPLKAPSYSFDGEVLLLPGNGANVGQVFYYNGKFEAYQRTYIVKDISIEPRYLYYYFLSFWKESGVATQYGSATNYIKIGNFQDFKIKVAPLPEQKRIVAKLDLLFGHLDTLKTKLDHIPELLKNFRQQVLTQAVTGKLTEEWRKGKRLGKWKEETASECCEKVQSGGTPKKDGFANEGIPFLKVYNIVRNKVDFDYRPQFVSHEAHNSKIKKSILFPGDVLMNIVGPPLNKIALVPNDFDEWNLNQAITLFRTKEYLSNKFLYYFFCEGTSVRSVTNETRGVVGQVNISLTQCRNFSIPIPTFEEQQEIVHRIEELFALSDSIESQYHSLKSKIDNLPQAILNKAFRGELVPQDENDEPAGDLLKRIKALQEEAAPKPKKAKNYKLKKSEMSIAAEEGDVYG